MRPSKPLLRAVLVPVVALAALMVPTSPAGASAGDVLTMQVLQPDGGYTRTTTNATWTGYGDSGPSAGGALVKFDAVGGVTLAPPTGSRFQAGQTYAAGLTATSSRALMRPTTCDIGASSTFTGSVQVLAAAYDSGGALTELAADYTVTCTPIVGGAERSAGSVRHGSTVPWVSATAAYDRDIVPLGRQRTHDVTVTGAGSGGRSVTLGAASLQGARAADYSVVSNGCLGVTLGAGDSCRVGVSFAPLSVGDDGGGERMASLSLGVSGQALDTLRVRLDSQVNWIPAAPSPLTTFPTASGLGVAWARSSNAQQYVLARQRPGETTWTDLVTVPDSGSTTYVDTAVDPGSTAAYRVTPSNAGWDGPAAQVTGTRATDLPTPTSRILVSATRSGASSADVPDAVSIAAGDPDSEVRVYDGGVSASHSTPGSATSQSVNYALPHVAGPGTYRGGAELTGDVTSLDNLTCTTTDRVLVVRHVLYDSTGAPVVFDASWAGHCTDGTGIRLELRIASDTADTSIAAAPVTVDLATHGNLPVPRTVRVTNTGATPVTLGQASVGGTAPGDWSVTGNRCAGHTLAPSGWCEVDVAFATSAVGARPATLEVAAVDSDGALAPVLVPLRGVGATVPSAPFGFTDAAVGAVLLRLYSSGDGGLPIQHFEIQRRDEHHAWQVVGSVPGAGPVSWVDRSVARRDYPYDYRVRAVNAVGAGEWQTVGFTGVGQERRGIVVSARQAGSGNRALFLVTTHTVDTPVVPLTDDPAVDFRDPAVSPAGQHLAVSVGTGSEYDLFAGTLKSPTAVRLTSQSGAERDAAFSPDATQVAYTHLAVGHSEVYVVPTAGGTPRLVRADAAGPAWTPDGQSLVVQDTSTTGAPLLVIDAADGTTRSTVPDSAGASDPAIAADGAIAWARAGSVYELSPGATTAVHQAGDDTSWSAGHPAFRDQGQLVEDLTDRNTGQSHFTYTNLLSAVVEPAPVLDDLDPPNLVLSGPGALVAGSAGWSATTSDDATPAVALHPRCRLDTGAWQPCGTHDAPGGTTGIADGTHTLTAQVADEAGQVATQSVTFVSDTRPPAMSLTAPAVISLLPGVATFRWRAADAGSGSPVYDLTVATATPTRALSSYARPAGWSTTDSRSALSLRPAPGTVTCVRVRARDAAGFWSPYVTRCVARPLDDGSLRASKGWRRARASGLYLGAEKYVARTGATLSSTASVTTRRVGVLATTCKACGSVRVYVGTRYLGAVSLVSARTLHEQVRYLPLPRGLVSGRVQLRTTSARAVHVDGLLLSRS